MFSTAVLILTRTSIFGMHSKPIKDWIPEFPALHRWIIPENKKKEKKWDIMRQKDLICIHHECTSITEVVMSPGAIPVLTRPGAKGCHDSHSAGQEAGLSVLPVTQQHNTFRDGTPCSRQTAASLCSQWATLPPSIYSIAQRIYHQTEPRRINKGPFWINANHSVT